MALRKKWYLITLHYFFRRYTSIMNIDLHSKNKKVQKSILVEPNNTTEPLFYIDSR